MEKTEAEIGLEQELERAHEKVGTFYDVAMMWSRQCKEMADDQMIAVETIASLRRRVAEPEAKLGGGDE